MTETADPTRAFLRHTLATLAYRGGKAVRGAPFTFATFQAGEGSRSAGQILAHVGDLMDWALHLADGRHVWRDSTPQPWPEECARFFAALAALDARLSSAQPLGATPQRLFQGPIADALTHVGQIALLRRLAGAAVRGENYYKADIDAGRVGPEQATPRFEFD
jgi:hypothetical protein